MSELKQSDLIVTKEETKKKIELKKEIPEDFITIKYSSLGKLETPKELHFRNYTMKELLKISASNQEDRMEDMVNVLSGMNFENFDCQNFTEQELVETLMFIYARWHGTSITKIPYRIDTDKELTEDNTDYADVRLSNIDTNTIDEKFKEPFTITHPETKEKIAFKVPKIRESIFAETYTKQKYFKEIKKSTDIKTKIMHNQNLDTTDPKVKEYLEFQEKISTEIAVIILSLCLYDPQLSDEEKIKKSNTIDIYFWKAYQKILDQYCKFGINQEVKFHSHHFKKKISRRLPLRKSSFIPSLELQNDSEVIVDFGVSL